LRRSDNQRGAVRAVAALSGGAVALTGERQRVFFRTPAIHDGPSMGADPLAKKRVFQARVILTPAPIKGGGAEGQ